MRMIAWTALAFTGFMIFVVTMDTMQKDDWLNAVSVDGAVTNYTRSNDDLLSHLSHTNPFTEQEARQYFRQTGS